MHSAQVAVDRLYMLQAAKYFLMIRGGISFQGDCRWEAVKAVPGLDQLAWCQLVVFLAV